MRAGRVLKRSRIVLAVVVATLITVYFLDFAGLLPDSVSWLAKIQFAPAVLSGSLVIVAILLILTLLFGRIYCSVFCPMGVFQDLAAWFSKRGKKKRRFKYNFSKPKTILRLAVLLLAIVAAVAGLQFVLGLIEPYSAYGRMVTALFRPLYVAGNNGLEAIFTSFGDHTFYREQVAIISVSALVIGVVTFLMIGFLAWRNGRTYCNTICPVGTILGFFSRRSWFGVRIDTGKCTSCGLCEKTCKAACIDSKGKTVDRNRCVDCFNCLNVCKFDAIHYTLPGKCESGEKVTVKRSNLETERVDQGRRNFIVTGLAAAVAVPKVLAQTSTTALSGGEVRTRQVPISPPGAEGFGHMSKHCTSCHLCIARCPSKVLKPAFLEYGLGGMMQPMMYFERGYCNYDCTVCSNVCPNGALHSLTKEEKHRRQVGRVTFNESICIVVSEGTSCGACSEHCPTQAVKMVPYRDGLTIPELNPDICVGCGGCEFICPVRPVRAIFVEGNAVHQEALPFEEEHHEEVEITDFGF